MTPSEAWALVMVSLRSAYEHLSVDGPGLDDSYLPRLYVDIEWWFSTIGEGRQFERHVDRIRAERAS